VADPHSFTVVFDRSACQGHARCNAAAPEFFSIDDGGYCDLSAETPVPEGMMVVVREAVGACPERALQLREDT